MKKSIIALIAACSLTLGACAITPVDNQPTKLQATIAEAQSNITKARVGLALARVAFAAIPVCAVDTQKICLSTATQVKIAGYADVASTLLSTASAILSTNPTDPVQIASAVAKAVAAVEQFADQVSSK